LAVASHITFKWKRCGARVGEGEISGRFIVLAKPQTFMNRSGESVVRLLKRYESPPRDLVVVHDDLDLDEGRVKLKRGGGHGGHNGLRSIVACCGTGEFIRVRVGIGRPPKEMEAADYVLSDFPDPSAVGVVTAKATEIIEYLLRNDLQAAMNLFHSNQ
ncbi:MAG: aminoacyl-tRNA hydrolase, partial [bacterium]|nr:aminoacyl-tRNA hydrolase [bacterium]